MTLAFGRSGAPILDTQIVALRRPPLKFWWSFEGRWSSIGALARIELLLWSNRLVASRYSSQHCRSGSCT